MLDTLLRENKEECHSRSNGIEKRMMKKNEKMKKLISEKVEQLNLSIEKVKEFLASINEIHFDNMKENVNKQIGII